MKQSSADSIVIRVAMPRATLERTTAVQSALEKHAPALRGRPFLCQFIESDDRDVKVVAATLRPAQRERIALVAYSAIRSLSSSKECKVMSNTKQSGADTSRIFHKFGGRVTPTHVGHRTDSGVPSWYVRGDVQWDDGTKSEALEISPGQLCVGDGADELPGHQQLNVVLDALNKYLGEAGGWLREPKRVRGVFVHWLPHEKAGEIPLSSSDTSK